MHEFIGTQAQVNAEKKPSLDIRIRDVCAAAADVRSEEDFRTFIRDEVRHLLPHGALVCGHGPLLPGDMAFEHVLTVDYPVECLPAAGSGNAGIGGPLLHRWRQTESPVLFDAMRPWADMPEEWLVRFRDHGLVNAAVHAHIDEGQGTGSYFSFHGLPPPLGQLERAILIGMTPLLHETLLRVIDGRAATS